MDSDIIIIGAGPAGLSFARILADTGLKITMLERQTEKTLAKPDYDGREIALTHLSQRLMDETGMWSRIKDADISLIKDAKVLNGDLNDPLFFDHTKSGKENLGFMISNHHIRRAAYEVCKPYKNINLMTEKEVWAVETDDVGGTVTLKGGKKLRSRLIVAADSRFSATRRMMGISTDMRDFGRTCIVCKVKLDKDHDETAYECFFYDRTVAILPLKGRYCSVVITIDSKDAHLVLDQSPKEFAQELSKRMEGRFGKMTLDTQLYPYPLVGTFADCFYANRYALIGDAAVGMHPVTAHGFNFGLRGAHTLATEIKKFHDLGLDIGSREILQHYNTSHRQATWPLYMGTNALVGLYTKTTPLAKLARKALLSIGQHLPPAKRMIMNQLTEAAS
ncbi:MAG TPA: 5-demethoxyubiquinol-8 5-hydroxylase UbiM [Alphaproteobacteria bacterium]|nr:5-demethoxyubiquinol-8 5-hydroxylase UbiM [Alphaproteobacteria bacterium]HOO51176.1 5-demethoxyubiquinol-8 5-hydroxylase UbiM [Alphaproteobacteria bacterium]